LVLLAVVIIVVSNATTPPAPRDQPAVPELASDCLEQALAEILAAERTFFIATSLEGTVPLDPPNTLTPAVYAGIERSAADRPGSKWLREGARVILVSVSCSHQPLESETWLAPGTRGVFWGVVRKRQEWIDGLPTIDVRFTQDQPFPHRPRMGPMLGLPDRISLEEFYSLLEALPTRSELSGSRRSRERGHDRMLQWQADNPEAQFRFPAYQLLWMVFARSPRYPPLNAPPSPDLSGTYSVRVIVPGWEPLERIVRTDARAAGNWPPQPRLEPPRQPTPFWPEGIGVAFIAIDHDSVANDAETRERLAGTSNCTGAVYVRLTVDLASSVARGGAVVQGGVMPRTLVRCWWAPPRIRREDSAFNALYLYQYKMVPETLGGEFRVHPDGRVTLYQSMNYSRKAFPDWRDEPIIVEAERISRKTWDRPDD
jgi:hypothetical protein